MPLPYPEVLLQVRQAWLWERDDLKRLVLNASCLLELAGIRLS